MIKSISNIIMWCDGKEGNEHGEDVLSRSNTKQEQPYLYPILQILIRNP